MILTLIPVSRSAPGVSALNGTGRAILKDHISHCIVDAVEAGDQEAIQSLNDAIDRFMR